MTQFKYTLDGRENMGIVSISSQDFADIASTQLDLINQGCIITGIDYGRSNYTYLYIERKSKINERGHQQSSAISQNA